MSVYDHEIYESDEYNMNEIINADPKYKVEDIIAIEYDGQVADDEKRYYTVMMNANGEKIAKYTAFENLRRGGRKYKRKSSKRKSSKRKTSKRKTSKHKKH